jgi:DNA-binding CsgD family transcriptional regulator
MWRGGAAAIVGRDDALGEIEAFLGGAFPGTLVLRGTPGVGKTTLWEAALATASARNVCVLRARPNEAESHLPLGCLGDLLEGTEDACASLPPAQATAIDVALFRADPVERQRDSRALGVAFRNVLRQLTRAQRVVVAVDDVQWMDPASLDVVAFAARRLVGEPVSFLFGERVDDERTGIASRLDGNDTYTVDLRGLSLGAIRRILLDRLGLELPRRGLRELHDWTGGNPLFALEVGRVLAERGVPEPGEPWPVPGDVHAVVRARIARLPKGTRELLLAAALLARPELDELRRILGLDLELDAAAAFDAGIARTESGTLVFAHPLYAGAVVALSGTSERRSMHRRLAEVVESEEERATHLALGSTGVDERIASQLAGAAESLYRRGACSGAVELSRHALRLTPPSLPVRPERLLALCQYMMVAGEAAQAHDLLTRELDALPEGIPRARAHLLLGDGRVTLAETAAHFAHIEEAAAQGRDDPSLVAAALARKAHFTAVARLERLPESEAWSLEALALARRGDTGLEHEALHALAWARVLQGRSIDDLRTHEDTSAHGSGEILRSLARVRAERHACRGEIEPARRILAGLADRARERGEEWSLAWLRLSHCELEIRAGEWQSAAAVLDGWEADPDETRSLEPARARCGAFVAAALGDVTDCERLAGEALAVESVWNRFEVERARALAALLAARPDEAVERLAPIHAHLEREGVTDPGVFPIASDLVDALVLAGRTGEAPAAVAALSRAGVELDHPWARLSAVRCDATLRLAEGDTSDTTVDAIWTAAAELEALGLHFDHARSLIALGRGARRLRRRAVARRAFEAAWESFEMHGASGWALAARAELERLSGRRSACDGSLTPSERRAVELAAQGLSNKEIAATLVVSVHTVEVHLSHAYRKLGVRSRGQLASTLATVPH